jgi:hypothetical protein
MPKRPTKKPGSTLPAHLKGLLPPPFFGPLNRPPSEAELDARRLRILIERIEQLAKHHGIHGTLLNKCFWLCVELAKELGLFDEPAKRGRKRLVWTDDEQMQLVKKVDAIKAERDLGIEDAIRILQRREPRYRQKDHDIESRKSKAKNPLATRYYEAAEKFKPLPEGVWGGGVTRRSKTRTSTRR